MPSPTFISLDSHRLVLAASSVTMTRIHVPKVRLTDCDVRTAPRRRSLILGRWSCETLIGWGQTSRVYAARPVDRPRDWPLDYIVKILNPRFDSDPQVINLFRREACVGLRVSHRHLVPVLTAQLNQPPYYIVFPRIAGTMLSRCIARVRPLRIPMALWIVRQTAEALKALHSSGWLHGDIKPENVLVAMDGHVTLIDLGFARLIDEPFYVADRPFAGTLDYAAPECLSSRLARDSRSEIYSLGVLLFECLTGSKPFETTTAAALVEAHRSQPPPRLRQQLPHLPCSVSDLVQRMLAKNPIRRPQTTQELINDLISLEIATLEQHVAA